MKTALKTLAAASVVLAAGFAHAQSYPVQGLDREVTANAVGGSSYINIDQDVDNPNGCLAYLSGFEIQIPAASAANGYTYGANASWSKTWTDGCGLEPRQIDFFGSGFRVIYEWGVNTTPPTPPLREWHDGCNNGSGDGGIYNTAISTTDGDPDWDCAQLTVTVDAAFQLQSINLITRKQGLPLEEMVYDLY